MAAGNNALFILDNIRGSHAIQSGCIVARDASCMAICGVSARHQLLGSFTQAQVQLPHRRQRQALVRDG
jgi:hypothetical protein